MTEDTANTVDITVDDAVYVTEDYVVCLVEMKDPAYSYEYDRVYYGVISRTYGVVEHESRSLPAAIGWCRWLQEGMDKAHKESDEYETFLEDMIRLDNDDPSGGVAH